jgi:hypothetical protein
MNMTDETELLLEMEAQSLQYGVDQDGQTNT